MRCDICIPAYNEALIIKTSTQRVLDFCKQTLNNLDWQIVLVINGSNDASPLIAQELSSSDIKIKNIIFTEPGRGQALKKYWQQSQAEIVCYMDSDLAVDLVSLPKLLEPIIKHEADLVYGNRYHKLATVERSLLRELSSRMYNLIARAILGHKQKDLQCGFKALNKEAFLKLSDKTNDPGWFFDTELILWSNKLGLKTKDVPVNWRETRLGARPSKVKLISTTINFIKRLLSLKKQLKQYNPTKTTL